MVLPLSNKATAVNSAKAVDGKLTEYAISGVRGLKLLVLPSGTGTFYLSYTAHRVAKRLKLGRRDTMSLADANIAAMTALLKVSGGSDPVADAKALRTAMTVADLVEAYLASEGGPSVSTRVSYKASLGKDIVPALGKVPIVELTADMVADALDIVVARGSLVQADRTKAALSSAITWGIKSRRAIGLRQNVCRVLPARASSKPRSRGIADHELAALWLALGKVTEPIALCARLAWITASRRLEVVGARRCELDLANARWTIPGDTMVKGRIIEGRTKSGQTKVVPLSTHAVDMFARALELSGSTSAQIFPAQRGAETFLHLDPHSVSRAIARLRVDAGASDVRLHDGRAAARTYLRDAGYSESILDAALGHSGTSIGSRHYEAATLKFVEKQLRPALQDWSDHVAGLVGFTVPGRLAETGLAPMCERPTP